MRFTEVPHDRDGLSTETRLHLFTRRVPPADGSRVLGESVESQCQAGRNRSGKAVILARADHFLADATHVLDERGQRQSLPSREEIPPLKDTVLLDAESEGALGRKWLVGNRSECPHAGAL